MAESVMYLPHSIRTCTGILWTSARASRTVVSVTKELRERRQEIRRARGQPIWLSGELWT